MKFKYLKLTLLMASLFVPMVRADVAPGEAKVEHAVKDLVAYLNPEGPQHTADETIAKLDEVMAVLAEYPEYQDLYVAVGETKTMFIQASVAQAKGVLDRVAGQLETLHGSLSSETKNLVNSRLGQLKNLSLIQKGKFLGKLGISIKFFGKK